MTTLRDAVIKQLGYTDGDEELAGTLSDIANHGIEGGFCGFTYYSDTVAFTEEHFDLIMNHAGQLADDLGEGGICSLVSGFGCVGLSVDEVAEALYNNESENRFEVYNALAWFAAEEVAHAEDYS